MLPKGFMFAKNWRLCLRKKPIGLWLKTLVQCRIWTHVLLLLCPGHQSQKYALRARPKGRQKLWKFKKWVSGTMTIKTCHCKSLALFLTKERRPKRSGSSMHILICSWKPTQHFNFRFLKTTKSRLTWQAEGFNPALNYTIFCFRRRSPWDEAIGDVFVNRFHWLLEKVSENVSRLLKVCYFNKLFGTSRFYHGVLALLCDFSPEIFLHWWAPSFILFHVFCQGSTFRDRKNFRFRFLGTQCDLFQNMFSQKVSPLLFF